MNGFTKKSVGTLTLGEKLKKLRSDKRITLGEVSRLTKIQIPYLEYLEEGKYEKLPADVYVRGFLRSYADFLGVSEQILIKLYDKEKEIKKNLEKKKKRKEIKVKPVNISSFVFTPRKILALAVVVLIFAGLAFLYKEIDSFASAPSLVILSPGADSEISGNSVYIEGITDQDAALFINGQPISVGEGGRFRENLTLQSGLNVISVKSVNKFEKEAVRNITIKSNYKENEGASESPEDKINSGKENSEMLQIDIKVDPGPVWLSVEADGKLVFSGTMLSGAVQLFEARDKIVVNSGRGNATFVKFNGKDIGRLSEDAGAVREVTFTPKTKITD